MSPTFAIIPYEGLLGNHSFASADPRGEGAAGWTVSSSGKPSILNMVQP
jgi:hypothetical protein